MRRMTSAAGGQECPAMARASSLACECFACKRVNGDCILRVRHLHTIPVYEGETDDADNVASTAPLLYVHLHAPCSDLVVVHRADL